jgi:hypothetical protein
MRQFYLSLATIFCLFAAIACKENTQPVIPEVKIEKWAATDVNTGSSWLQIADNGSKLFVLNRFELLKIDENGQLEERYPMPFVDAYHFGISKDVFFFSTFENGKNYLTIAPNNNPTNTRKLDLGTFNGKKLYSFSFRSGEPQAGYFNSQNQLLFFNSLDGSYCYTTIDVALNAAKTDFTDCRIIDKKEFSLSNWSANSLRSSPILNDKIYFVDYSSSLRLDNGVSQVVGKFTGQEYGLDMFSWRNKLYIPYFQTYGNENKNELRYVSSTDNGLTWTKETVRDTIFGYTFKVINDKLITDTQTNQGTNFYVSDNLTGFRKINSQGLLGGQYALNSFYFFKGYYYVIVDKKMFKTKTL